MVYGRMPNMSSDLSSYPDIVHTLLKKRGITNAADADHFLYPDFARDVRDPFGILNMGKAVERILQAIDAGERIAIYADYDCDGIPGAMGVPARRASFSRAMRCRFACGPLKICFHWPVV